MNNQLHAESLLRQMLGEKGKFRPGQWEAIEAVAIKKSRVLVVQRTGWGKSLVYFLATKLLREQGAGATLLISPLLSLMRNQVDMAKRIGINAFTINSGNREDWNKAEKALSSGSCDVLLVSPERLNKKHFIDKVLPRFLGKIGLFVVDEAHCISDWGHDFRPDYSRIVRIIKAMPKGVPVLGTTATANDRVVKDVSEQLGEEIRVIRGPLRRKSLHLKNIVLDGQAERLAWLAENLPKLSGSGIVYCLTVADTVRVATWLKQKGFMAEAYHAGGETAKRREELEDSFLKNETKILVATVALGMGFDKPDIGFVVHFQRPASVVAYYQQVGRAGRALDHADGILLSGKEDDEIQEYFLNSAFPPEEVMTGIVNELSKVEKLTVGQLLGKLNYSRQVTDKALKLLELDGAIGHESYGRWAKWFRTTNPWEINIERINRVLALRRKEMDQIRAYVTTQSCLMWFLEAALDDPTPGKCDQCANCMGKHQHDQVSPELVMEAQEFLKRTHVVLRPKESWPTGVLPPSKRVIPEDRKNAVGWSLCHYGDKGLGKLVSEGKYHQDHFDDDLVKAATKLIEGQWKPDPPPRWITSIPSKGSPNLVPDFCRRLSSKMRIPYHPVLKRMENPPKQKAMKNISHQAENVLNLFKVNGEVWDVPVLLVDDIVDSGWTLTAAGFLLREKGCSKVYPFTLAKATPRGDLD
ncbi:MAG: RecQ family ATP-dependent DNA helicase [Desulfobacteria bacterium]